MKITGMAFTVYPSNDVASARAWYERTLGLRFAGPYVEDGIEKYNEAHFPDGCFALMASEWVGREPGTAASVYFEVDDIVEAIASLRVAGTTVEEPYETPVCTQTSLHDSEGNRIWLHQRAPGR
jgi:predicted enzyme related to lactoylglutathione lyase